MESRTWIKSGPQDGTGSPSFFRDRHRPLRLSGMIIQLLCRSLFGFLVHQVPSSNFFQYSLAPTNLLNRLVDQFLLGLKLLQLWSNIFR